MPPKKKNNSWIESLKLLNQGSNTFCIPAKGTDRMRAVKNIQSYVKLSDADKKKYFKASPVSKEGMQIMQDKANEKETYQEKEVYYNNKGRKQTRTITQERIKYQLPFLYGDIPNYEEEIVKASKKYYGVGLSKTKRKEEFGIKK